MEPIIDYAEDWPGSPSEHDMLRQHAHLISEENRLLQAEVTRYRKNLAKLIDMHNEASLERDRLRLKVRELESRVSQLLLDASNSWKEIHSLKGVIDQHRSLLVTANVDPAMWGQREASKSSPDRRSAAPGEDL
ncbi:hypothetical protein KDX38_23300 [Pseudomonas sp. CDFA 602]|uniref:hypothetical protein n=1 Tax=Pseudomonas californiensis TaxID=2829823 RepID=UPI001E64625B|nr:hypothetical protein [Pseudomonas californiensis]MCD5996520.1 hypothetical protein [Pseudomonas californiensis]MCD6002119.1 hypothetical protein [Pseudomonas californiensis]